MSRKKMQKELFEAERERRYLRFADPRLGTSATLDHDATIIESHNHEAKAHYKGGRGYQPSAVLWTGEDLGVADEFRDGNVPAAKDNLRLIRRAFL